jgi:uncharacterized protein
MLDLLLVAIGFLVGGIGTLVGAGGGFLLVPIMLFLYPDEAPATITSTSLAIVLINSVSGSFAYIRQGRIDVRTGLPLALATMPGSVIGVLLAGRIDRAPFTIIFSVVLLAVAGLLFARPTARPRATELDPTQPGTRVLVDRSGQRYVYRFPMRLALPFSIGIGVVSSLLGIGGGFILVPAFILWFGIPTLIATATSQFMLAVMSLSGTATHIALGDFQDAVRRTVILAPGVIAGSQAGAWLSRRIRPVTIARILAVMMTLAAIRLIWTALS